MAVKIVVFFVVIKELTKKHRNHVDVGAFPIREDILQAIQATTNRALITAIMGASNAVGVRKALGPTAHHAWSAAQCRFSQVVPRSIQ
ncbi:unannotated protein [freshwater metagenome]|uniref:Unannotated protein n=1 Tax=freshwater metagenome TaxID=449393 RepID=A0A6J6BUB5_9ZZZZ